MISFIRKIRAEFSIYDDNTRISPSLKETTQAVQNLIDGKSKQQLNAQKILDNGSKQDIDIKQIGLTSDEKSIAEDFMKSLDETGFTKIWEAELKTELDLQNTISNNIKM